jgi:hypothetical protein
MRVRPPDNVLVKYANKEKITFPYGGTPRNMSDLM